MLNQSPLFTQVLQGRAPEVKFTINGSEYNMGYYLADGIYPEWATFLKTITLPLTEKDRLFAQHQEGARKDVECAFGILQKRWAIIRHPAHLWDRQELEDIMMACIILHNMIVEDERTPISCILTPHTKRVELPDQLKDWTMDQLMDLPKF